MELKIRYENGYSFDVSDVSENDDKISGNKNLVIRIPIKDDIEEIETNLIPENLKNISVIKDGKVVYVFKDYINIQSVQKNINKQIQIFNITLDKEVKS